MNAQQTMITANCSRSLFSSNQFASVMWIAERLHNNLSIKDFLNTPFKRIRLGKHIGS